MGGNEAGVVAIITPWNAPLMLATWKLGPAWKFGSEVDLKVDLQVNLEAELGTGLESRPRWSTWKLCLERRLGKSA